MVILLLLFAISVSSKLFAQEKVTVRVEGEEYEQDMPQDLQSAQELIRDMATMINNSDDYIVATNESIKKERESYIEQIEELTKKLNDISEKSETVVEKVVYVEKDVDKLLKINTRFTPFFMVGPVIGTDKNIGMHVGVGGLYRMFRNLQIGGSLFSSFYQGSDRNFDIGVGLILAYSVY